jgi:hypothetical protein
MAAGAHKAAPTVMDPVMSSVLANPDFGLRMRDDHAGYI